MDAPNEDFALRILAKRESGLLSRIAHRLAWIGIEPERFTYSTGQPGKDIRVEVMFSASCERADLVVSQLRKLVAVGLVELKPIGKPIRDLGQHHSPETHPTQGVEV
jgi:hypothetical protein